MVSPDLLARCKRGDRTAFEQLVQETHRRVYTLAYRLVGDRSEAEDVAQEAYLRMFRGLGGFREEAAFETWMHRIVANCAMTYLRKKNRFGDLMREDVPEVAAEDRSQQLTVDRDELERGLADLPEGLRICVLLKDVYGLSSREIAQELGIQEGAVKVRVHRGRRRLKELLEEGMARDAAV
jgi:RNA polymerase sigma-70 factor (ECF subfamily)